MKYLIRIENCSFCLEYEIDEEDFSFIYEMMLAKHYEKANIMLHSLAYVTMMKKDDSEFTKSILNDSFLLSECNYSIGIYNEQK